MDGIIARSHAFPGNSPVAERALGLGPARRLLTARLSALGRPQDCVTPEARSAIVEQAHGAPGGERRLQSVLATALFLAEAEHAPQVDLAMVQRAAALQPYRDSREKLPAPGKGRATWIMVLGGGAALCVAALLLVRQTQHAPVPAAAVPSHTIVTVARAPLPSQTVPTKIATVVPRPSPPVANTRIAPSATVVPAWHPAAPPGLLVLRFRTASPGAAAGAQLIAQHLEGAGFAVRMVPDASRTAPRSAALRFFYQEDRSAAQRVKQALLLSTEPALQPMPRALGASSPGTIELYLP